MDAVSAAGELPPKDSESEAAGDCSSESEDSSPSSSVGRVRGRMVTEDAEGWPNLVVGLAKVGTAGATASR